MSSLHSKCPLCSQLLSATGSPVAGGQEDHHFLHIAPSYQPRSSSRTRRHASFVVDACDVQRHAARAASGAP
eukprot:366519-Chlamydomonas_euryale.AAC.25